MTKRDTLIYLLAGLSVWLNGAHSGTLTPASASARRTHSLQVRNIE